MRGSMPDGVRPDLIVFRQADFINASVNNVQRVMIEAIIAVAFGAGLHHRAQVLLGHPRPGHQGRDLLLLNGFPLDELADVWVIDINDDHLGGAPGGAA